mgnify:CR=1 FL=1
MTVIRPNSVSGITSITAQANEINVFRSNGLIAGLNLNGVNFNTTAGISTLAALKITGNLDVAGVLTYQDVTNVDSLGIGTFRVGVNVPAGQLDVGSNIKLGNAGVITATSFVGSGAQLTGITQTTINNNTNNYVVTATGTANTLNGEANLLFDGGTLALNGRYQRGSATVQDGEAIAGALNINGTDMDSSIIMSVFGNDNDFTRISGSKSRNASVGSHTIVQNNDVLLSLKGFGSDGTNFEEAAQIEMQVDGSPGNNVMPGRIVFKTATTDGVAERLRISSDGTTHFYGNQASAPEGDFGFRWDRNQPVNLQLTNTNNTSVNAGARITLKSNIGTIAGSYYNNGGFYINNASSSGYLHYYEGSDSRLYIDTSGNISINNGATPPSSNGALGKRFGIKSTANNVIIGETTQSGTNYGLHIESRQTSRGGNCLLYTSPSPRDKRQSRMPSSA